MIVTFWAILTVLILITMACIVVIIRRRGES